VSSNSAIQNQSAAISLFDARARVAIDLGAESCRVSLLRWIEGRPVIELLHRIPNGPVHRDGALMWPLDEIIAGLEEGLRKAAAAAPEGIASIAVDGWAVDYVRLDAEGTPLAPPYCYRDERTIQSKLDADADADPAWVFSQTGTQPHRINTVYQHLADSPAIQNAPWLCLPEYVLFRLGARPVAEYTNATHTGLVDLETGDWSQPLLDRFKLSRDAFPPIVHAGTVIGKLQGPLSSLDALRDTELIVPACHDTASAIAGICTELANTAYLCSGTWSLIGTVVDGPVTSEEALLDGFTNLGTAGGGYCFHTNVNGMWLLKQCLNAWENAGRTWSIPELIEQAETCDPIAGTISVSAPSLLLDGDMPARLNEQLRLAGLAEIPDTAGNEPRFARLIFESLAQQYAFTLNNLEHLLGRRFERIHILGGGSLNQLLNRLTAEKTGLIVERGHVESSTIGNFAIQLASAEAGGHAPTKESIQRWAGSLCEQPTAPALT
jgi:rhamnulokinase